MPDPTEGAARAATGSKNDDNMVSVKELTTRDGGQAVGRDVMMMVRRERACWTNTIKPVGLSDLEGSLGIHRTDIGWMRNPHGLT